MEKSINVARVQCRTCLDELRSYGGRFVWCSCHEKDGEKGIAIDHTPFYTRYIGRDSDMNHLPSQNWAGSFITTVISHTKLLPGVDYGND